MKTLLAVSLIMLSFCAESAREFLASPTQTIWTTDVPLTTYPCTIAAWCKLPPTNTVATGVIAGFGSTTDNRRLMIYVLPSANLSRVSVQSVDASGTTGVASSVVNYKSNTWVHVTGVFASATSRTVYYNGGSQGSSFGAVNTTGLNTFSIGSIYAGTNGFTNRVIIIAAEVGVWNVALSANEVALISGAGDPTEALPPRYMRPDKLVIYAPLDSRNSEYEWLRNSLQSSNAPAYIDHPAIHRPNP